MNFSSFSFISIFLASIYCIKLKIITTWSFNFFFLINISVTFIIFVSISFIFKNDSCLTFGIFHLCYILFISSLFISVSVLLGFFQAVILYVGSFLFLLFSNDPFRVDYDRTKQIPLPIIDSILVLSTTAVAAHARFTQSI